jgi:hypothetical protein
LLASQLATYGKPVDDEDVVAKLLRVVPSKYAQLALSIETMLGMSELTLEDVTGRLRAVEDRSNAAPEKKEGGKLLLTEEEWTARLREKRRSREGSSKSGGGRGGDKQRGKQSTDKQKKKKGYDPNAYRKYGKSEHWAKECPGKKPEKKGETHLARDDSDDECALLMGEYCAL